MSLQMYPRSPLAEIKYFVAIAAGKGGVGKSTVTINLALALKELGYQVGIMDTDIYGPSIRKMLREDRLPHQRGERVEPALCDGIKMISMAYFKKEHEASVVRAPIANRLVSQFIQNVSWGKLDFLLIDFPPGTGDVQLTLTQQINLTGAVMVTTPQEVAVLDVRKAMGMFDLVKVPIIGIVENMSYYQPSPESEKVFLFGRGGGENLALQTGSPFLGSIPVDPIISQCCDNGISLFNLADSIQKPSLPAFKQFARSVVDQIKSIASNESLIKSLSQKDDFTVSLVWNDGKEQDIRLRDLQKACPCANCTDEFSGKRILDENGVKDDVKALAIRNVGRYGVQIKFSSGCSTGIFSFDALRKMKSEEGKI